MSTVSKKKKRQINQGIKKNQKKKKIQKGTPPPFFFWQQCNFRLTHAFRIQSSLSPRAWNLDQVFAG